MSSKFASSKWFEKVTQLSLLRALSFLEHFLWTQHPHTQCFHQYRGQARAKHLHCVKWSYIVQVWLYILYSFDLRLRILSWCCQVSSQCLFILCLKFFHYILSIVIKLCIRMVSHLACFSCHCCMLWAICCHDLATIYCCVPCTRAPSIMEEPTIPEISHQWLYSFFTSYWQDSC